MSHKSLNEIYPIERGQCPSCGLWVNRMDWKVSMWEATCDICFYWWLLCALWLKTKPRKSKVRDAISKGAEAAF